MTCSWYGHSSTPGTTIYLKEVQCFARLLTFAGLALPFLLALFWLPPDCSPLSRTRCGHLECHLGFSSVRESRGDRLKSSPLPEIRFQQMFGQAGPGRDRTKQAREPEQGVSVDPDTRIVGKRRRLVKNPDDRRPTRRSREHRLG